ncbi:pupal cuticle protein 27-like [Rhynchophorus ferrugineus]|uniref:pupal cuticle protein 27-like n=1 Tax=Rhynchophorus ferrugineus TaxID=354439 RepID=UPI003FCC46DC
MKQFVLLSAILGFAASASLNNLYLPPNPSSGGALGPGNAPFGGRGGPGSPAGPGGPHLGPGGFPGAGGHGRPGVRTGVNPLNDVPIVKFAAENEDGTYRYSYQTGHGIGAQEEGDARGDGTKAHGSYSFTSDNGEQVSLSYTADENGFVPQGSHIPTSPPIPEAILKSLQDNAADEARGIFDDGSYHGEGLNEGQYKGEGLAEANAGSGAGIRTGGGFGGAGAGAGFGGAPGAGAGFGGAGAGHGGAPGAGGAFGGAGSGFGGAPGAGGAGSGAYAANGGYRY